MTILLLALASFPNAITARIWASLIASIYSVHAKCALLCILSPSMLFACGGAFWSVVLGSCVDAVSHVPMLQLSFCTAAIAWCAETICLVVSSLLSRYSLIAALMASFCSSVNSMSATTWYSFSCIRFPSSVVGGGGSVLDHTSFITNGALRVITVVIFERVLSAVVIAAVKWAWVAASECFHWATMLCIRLIKSTSNLMI